MIAKICIILTCVLAVVSCKSNVIYKDCCPVHYCEKGATVLDLENGYDCLEKVVEYCKCP